MAYKVLGKFTMPVSLQNSPTAYKTPNFIDIGNLVSYLQLHHRMLRNQIPHEESIEWQND